MTTPNRPPLWRVMQEAGDEAAAAAVMNFDGFAIAAEIRALRDWLVPEESEPQAHLVDGECNPRWDHWRTRRQLRALLTTEADRAERGDD